MKLSYSLICLLALHYSTGFGAPEKTNDPAIFSESANTSTSDKNSNSATQKENNKTSANSPKSLEEITVKGEILSPYLAPNTRSASLIDVAPQELPTVVNSITKELIELKNATTLDDALQLESGIFGGGQTFGSRNPGQYTIRGMGNNEVNIDGMSIPGGMGFAFDTSMIERVEIVKGPIGSVSGGQTSAMDAGGAGGSINMILKSAKFDDSFGEIYASSRFGDGHRERLQFDYNHSSENGAAAFRVAGSTFWDKPFWLTNGADPGRGFAIAPSFAWKANSDTIITLQTNFQYADRPGYMGIPVLNGQFNSDWDAWFGGPDSRNIYRGTYANLKLEHQLNDIWTIESGVGISHMNLDYEQWSLGSTIPNYNNIINSGLSSWEYGNHQLRNTNVFGFARGIAKFETGNIKHQFVVSGDYTWRHSNRVNGLASITQKVNVWNPTPPPHPNLTYSKTRQNLDRFGALVQDYIAYGDWRFMLGSRFDQHISNRGNTGFSISPRAGVSRFLGKQWIGFANISMTEAPNFNYNKGPNEELTDSWRAVQYEVGARYNPIRDIWLSASAFAIEQSNMPQLDSSGLYYYADGENRSVGMEFSAYGSIQKWWNTSVSLTLTHYKNLETGDSFDRYPPFSLSFWNTFLIPSWEERPVKVSLGYRFNDTYMATFRGVKISESYTIPSWQTVDLITEIPLPQSTFCQDAYLRLALTNMFNEHYVSSNRHASQCFIGDPRMVEVSLRLKF